MLEWKDEDCLVFKAGFVEFFLKMWKKFIFAFLSNKTQTKKSPLWGENRIAGGLMFGHFKMISNASGDLFGE